MAIRVCRNEGHYNWANPNEVQANWTIYLPDDAPARTLSVSVDPGGEFDPDDEDDPWVIIDILEQYIDRLWISTSREEDKKIIQWMRDNELWLRKDWIQSKIDSLITKKQRLEDNIQYWERQLNFVKEDISDLG